MRHVCGCAVCIGCCVFWRVGLNRRAADTTRQRGIDGDEARGRRADNQVSIRKNKREDALAKRRQQEVVFHVQ